MTMPELPAFSLEDLSGESHSFPNGRQTIVCFVKEDCPTCNLVLPILDKIASGSDVLVLLPGQTTDGNRVLQERYQPTARILDDSKLQVSFAYDVESVPHLLLCDGEGNQIEHLIGFDKKEWTAFFDAHLSQVEIDWDELPDWRPACGSLTQDPLIAERLRAEAENSPLRARRIEVGQLDDIHEFMFDQGFTDGLPVVPPTPERVIRMLSGTTRDPQEEVAIVPPNLVPATVEKLAINAVLAGCKPEYLPVVIAGIEAICNDTFNGHGVFATTMGATPVMVINGPIRRKIGLNMGMSALGQGSRANAAIGRAVRLAIRNIGGAVPGGTERSTLGSPMKFTMCFAEWEERSPWAPLHVERGFQHNESVVTVFAMSGGPALVVDQASRQAAQLTNSMGLSLRAQHHVKAHGAGDTLLVISPEHVDTLMRDEFTKDDVREHIQHASAVSARELAANETNPVGIPAARVANMNDEDLDRKIPKFGNKNFIHIVVAGSEAGKFSASFHGWASGSMGSVPYSQKIE